MLRYTITHDRRRPVDEPATWYVHGACEPPVFDSLADAHVFIQRENDKYQNGRMLPFVPTHMILWSPPQAVDIRRRIPVRMIRTTDRVGVPAALYKQDDWQPCTIPEWGYAEDLDRLLLEGRAMGFSWSLVSYEDGLE